ncbi:MAG: ribbon-helix-helix protein, CopG family [Anaerolineaceae bacterium]|nr:ribbon-helix-helix protein, CopG family [Anaerolineaceae bacterium]
MERIQVLLDPWDRQELEKLAKEANMSMSGIIRDLIRDYVSRQKKIKLRKAAELMENEYRVNDELTAFSALDSEDFIDEA